MKRIPQLLILCFIYMPAPAQPVKLPAIDLNANLKLPPTAGVTDRLTQSYTEVVLDRQNDNSYDTGILRIFHYDPAGRILQRESYEYLSAMSLGELKERIAHIRRKVKDGRLVRYEYDARGNVRDELTYRIIPPNAYAVINRMVADRAWRETDGGTESGKMAAVARLERYADSLMTAEVPGYTLLMDSLHTDYNVWGNPDSSYETKMNQALVYSYVYDARGRVVRQRMLHLTRRGGDRKTGLREEHQYSYTRNEKIARVTSYRANNDSLEDIAVRHWLSRDQFIYYNVRGDTDSIIYRQGYRTIKELMGYEGRLMSIRTELDSERADGVFDTLSQTLYVYNNDSRLCQFFQVNFFDRKPESFGRQDYFYNSAGLPVEMQQRLWTTGESETSQPVTRQCLYFYGIPWDSSTAARKLKTPTTLKPQQERTSAKPDDQTLDKMQAFMAARQKNCGALAPSTEVYRFVEQMPEFPGSLPDYINTHILYAGSAKRSGIEGRVILRFIVESDGSIRNIEVIRKLSPDCDAAAIRMIRSMPRWKPGMQGGKAVAVYFTLPVSFRID